MEFKGTKGEWSAAPNGNVYRRDYKELYEYGGTIGGDFPIAYTTEGNPSWENKYNREANARLIAAAPELLRELQRIRLDIDLGTIPVRKDSPIYRGINEAINKALK